MLGLEKILLQYDIVRVIVKLGNRGCRIFRLKSYPFPIALLYLSNTKYLTLVYTHTSFLKKIIKN